MSIWVNELMFFQKVVRKLYKLFCWERQDWMEFSYIFICVKILIPIIEEFDMNLLLMNVMTLSVSTISGIEKLLMVPLSGVSSL